MNIFESILNSGMKNQIIKSIADKTGIDEQKVTMAVGVALPVILAKLGKNVSSDEGAQKLNAALDKHDGSILDNIMGAMSSGDALSEGSKILGHILGGQKEELTTAAAEKVGVDSSQMSDIMGMLGPVVMGSLGKAKVEGGLDAASLADQIKSITGDQSGDGVDLAHMVNNPFIKGFLDQDGSGSVDLGDVFSFLRK